jgi:mRNA-degrading endonuclease RelE of RelBE toxin-antitoxin system
VYRSLFTADALQDVKGLPKNVRNSLKKEFKKKIHVDPIACSEPLTGQLEGFRSFHHGDYRVVYRVFAELGAVSVVGIGRKDADHQAEIYKELEALAQKGKLAAAVLRSLRGG